MKNLVILIVAFSMIPASVVSTLNKDFQGYKKGNIEIFESQEIKGFELGLKKGEASIGGHY